MSAVPATKKPASRLVGLDGLRGALALCVIIVHVTAHYAPSILAVTHVEVLGQAIVVFFVMSGFLIYYPFARAILDARSPLQGIGGYSQARVLRVFPAYLVIFLVANAVGAVYIDNAMVVQSGGGRGGTGTITDPGALLLHLTLLNNYVPGELQTGINSSWTLTAEIAFYLLLPLVAAGVAAVVARFAPGLSRYVVAAVPGVVLIAIGAVARVVGAQLAAGSGLSPEMSEWGPNIVAVWSRSVLVWADNFGWGMVAVVVYLAVRREVLAPLAVRRLRWGLWAVASVFLLISAACYFVAPRFIAAAFAVLGAAVVLLIVLPVDGQGRTWAVARRLDNPVLFWLGTTSLSIYLWHYPVIIVLERWGLAGGDDWRSWLGSMFLVTAVSVGLASASYLLIEKPAMSLKSRRAAARQRA